MKIPDWLIICIFRSLLGEIYPAIRAIAIALNENGVLTMKFHLDRIHGEGDIEAAEVISTNISSAVGTQMVKNINISFECSDLRLGELDSLDGFIYCRREYDVDDIR
jgi:hypothetical protein